MKALEFYSGIGGMHYAFRSLCPEGTVVKAFDINEVANDVYQHNFGTRPKQGNIERVSTSELTKYGADVWLLAPPCQPYTRQGLQKHSADGRARSFLRLLQMLKQLPRQPRYLLLENVVGFEASDTHHGMLQLLAESSYNVQEFILTPTQYAFPYSRPRYFCLAKKSKFLADAPAVSSSIWHCTPSYIMECVAAGKAVQPEQEVPPTPEPIGSYLVHDPAAEKVLLVKREADHPVATPRSSGADHPVQTPRSSGADHPVQTPRSSGADHPVQTPRSSGADHPVEIPSSRGKDAPRVAAVSAPISKKARVDCDGSVAAGTLMHEKAASSDAAPPQGALCTGGLLEASSCPARESLPRPKQTHEAAARSPPASTPGAPAHEPLQRPEQTQDAAARSLPASTSGAPLPGDPWVLYRAQPKVLGQCADVIDVVAPGSHKANCFTKSYTQYAKGTGSFLCMLDTAGLAAHQLYITDKGNLAHRDPGVTKEQLASLWQQLGLRYFTAREAANLHGFPPSFSFPDSVTLRQRYQLIGNSLSVAVVADLLKYLFAEQAAPS